MSNNKNIGHPKKCGINRITTREFDAIFKAGRWFDSGFFSLRIAKIKKTEPLFAFVVSVKVSKKAVVRNKIKRRSRNIIRKLLPSIKKEIAIIVFFKKGAENLKFSELEEKLKEELKKARVLG